MQPRAFRSPQLVGLLLVAWYAGQAANTAAGSLLPPATRGMHALGRRPLSGKWGIFNTSTTYTFITPSAKRTTRIIPAPSAKRAGTAASNPPNNTAAAAAPGVAGSTAPAPASAPGPFDINIVNTNNGGASSASHEVLTQVYANGRLVATATMPSPRNTTARPVALSAQSPPTSTRQLKQLRGRFINNLAYSYSYSTRRYNIAVKSGPAAPPAKAGSGGGNGTSSGSSGGNGTKTGGSTGSAEAAGGEGAAAATVSAPVAAPIRINIVNVDNTHGGHDGGHSSILSLSQGGVPIVTVPLGGSAAAAVKTANSSRTSDPTTRQGGAALIRTSNGGNTTDLRAANLSSQTAASPDVMSAGAPALNRTTPNNRTGAGVAYAGGIGADAALRAVVSMNSTAAPAMPTNSSMPIVTLPKAPACRNSPAAASTKGGTPMASITVNVMSNGTVTAFSRPEGDGVLAAPDV